MKRKEAVTKLTMLKLMYGGNPIPLLSEISFNTQNKEVVEMVAELGNAKYLTYSYDNVIDDEGIPHEFVRGYIFSPKAHELLKEKAK